MTVADTFRIVDAKRREWDAIYPIQMESATPGSEITVMKALALRCLEMPVKSFISDGLSHSEIDRITSDGIKCLSRNMQDEDKHDLALNNCVKVFQGYDPKYEQQALAITKLWEQHPDNPITKAATLETSLFFIILPLYIRYGGPALRTTALDISSDEANHVQSHRAACELLGHRPSKSLDELRKLTAQWLVEDLNVEGDSPEKYLKSSDSLMYRGVAPELQATRVYTQKAFFETSGASLPYYK